MYEIAAYRAVRKSYPLSLRSHKGESMEFVVHKTNAQTNCDCSDDQTEPLSLHKTAHSIIHAVDLSSLRERDSTCLPF